MMKTNEAQFYEVLENLFIGVKIEDQPESLLNPNAKVLKMAWSIYWKLKASITTIKNKN